MPVTLTHPNLPGQPIEVEPAAVPHHARAGWREAPAPPPAAGDPAKEQADPEQAQKPRRRAKAATADTSE